MRSKRTKDSAVPLALRISRGEPFTPTDGPEIDALHLRTLFLAWGTSTKHPFYRVEGSRVEDGVITPAGVIIDGGSKNGVTIMGAEVDGERIIDLSYLAGSDGGPLPPLVIRNCRIVGKLSLTG